MGGIREEDNFDRKDFKRVISQLADQIKESEGDEGAEHDVAESFLSVTNQRKTSNTNRDRSTTRKRNTLECDQCSYVGDRLQRHKDSVHSDLKPFVCDTCGFASKRKDKLKEHIQN